MAFIGVGGPRQRIDFGGGPTMGGYQPVGPGQRIDLTGGAAGGGFRPVGGPMRNVGPFVGSFKKGGKVKKTGFAKVHKGEKISKVEKKMHHGGK
jgi:hypothetical protein